jgi:hypothetical protein
MPKQPLAEVFGFPIDNESQAVAIHRGFFNSLPKMVEVDQTEADLAWLVYDLTHDNASNKYHLTRGQIVYTKFEPSMLKLTTSEAGPVDEFVERLQAKLDDKLDDNPPDALTLTDETLQ